jgi:hypothetical protein
VKPFATLLIPVLLAGCTSAIDPIEPPTPLEEFKAELEVEHLCVRQWVKGSHE